MRIDSNRFVLSKNRPFDSLVVMQFFLLRAYLLYSLSRKIHQCTQLKAILYTTSTKTVTQCNMHSIKITPNLLFKYQCTSRKFIRLPNRIESKLFCPNWNALVQSCAAVKISTALPVLVNRRHYSAACPCFIHFFIKTTHHK